MSSPKVWIRFKVKTSDGTELKLRIQDLPSDRYNDAVEFYVKVMVPEETFHKAAGIANSKDATEEARILYSYLLKSSGLFMHICIADETDDVGEIIGISGVQLTTKADPNELSMLKDLAQTKEVQNLFKILELTEKLQNFHEKFNLERYWSGRGLIVNPKYRRLGIAQKLLGMRNMLCQEQNSSLSEAWMSSIASQKAAERVNWKTSLEISFEHLAELTGLSFAEAPEMCKSMYFKI